MEAATSTGGPLAIEWSTVLVAVIGAAGGAFVALIGARAKRRDDTQLLIDQLQEERGTYFKQLREEREANDSRLDRLWTDKAASRQYIADLRSHINKGSPPPPPVPAPGYIE